ncbi:flavohemoglobin expression-modulating QEGLA motif protein [Pseudofulvimonas gallinarii]|uniref:Uncharacterized protein (TIGR02421 family) n=1 Tax=Pseudofulvimonas gallinarii TaxID=634155 RepID=A0A4S3KTT1_9GAMM|nr:flavohemoglobin expression-modulating QEGLA motif protein [Pseudofulvimonas gallinarii]TCS94410.1 uncharacterized protein (TIGR02421 family) [Pseudofulvimonas gallinarii]THD12480.1 hypothetical protein B1808_12665 [Pseudofulvimonas gallinarii]
MSDLEHYAALDARLVAAARPIRLLSAASWPASVQNAFLAGADDATPTLPVVEYPRIDLSDTRRELDAIALAADATHPVGDYLRRSAGAYHLAAEIIESLGSPVVGSLSARLYGTPGEPLPGSHWTNVDAAGHFIVLADELDAELDDADSAAVIPAEIARDRMQAAIDAVFDHHRIQVQLDPELVAKAAAGATRVRLRSGSHFSAADVRQLLEHEVLVHSLTAINGREQPHFRSLAQSSPRVTATQEGLATFAEQITGCIDIRRMKRISLRILAIDRAIQGADFVEVYRFFRDAGQSKVDSFASSMRVFRGVPVTGGGAFCKDTVYLHGLLSVHTFFRWALKHRRLNLLRWIFAGKLALHDVLALEPFFEAGWLVPPTYLPHWAERSGNLAGLLAFSLFANRIRLDTLQAEDIVLGV